ncbi:integrin-linked protein kinase 1-like isoform X2 [Salvia miltiorrhiza]|uniref:integrin-linked protein kinase 1-like isoform X2 n=1 Tax=Salvia miltiorrhiza TaxID=226208 RepID=UPI0025AB5E6B|nr:integrin-linked protein kinase 1-like isoform X2 [Salvia miltiorrhiza]
MSGVDMQMIGNFLSFASRGDRVGLNDMLRQGMPPNVQDYDNRTALHLAASEGHASIVELLLAYNADVNLRDRWQRTPLADAKLYQHRDICRILELNGGRDLMEDQEMYVCHEDDPQENIDISELNLQNSSIIKQGLFGESEKVKWRGTCVVKTVISRHIQHPVKMVLTAKDNTLLGELRHPNILEFLGSIVHGEEMILITEHLPKGNLDDLLAKKVKLDPATCLRYALDIARNLLIDEGDQVKIGEYWVQMLYERIHPIPDKSRLTDPSDNLDASYDTNKDIYDFGLIFRQMLEGKQITNMHDFMHLKSVEFEKKFNISGCPGRIFQQPCPQGEEREIDSRVRFPPPMRPHFRSCPAIEPKVHEHDIVLPNPPIPKYPFQRIIRICKAHNFLNCSLELRDMKNQVQL